MHICTFSKLMKSLTSVFCTGCLKISADEDETANTIIGTVQNIDEVKISGKCK